MLGPNPRHGALFLFCVKVQNCKQTFTVHLWAIYRYKYGFVFRYTHNRQQSFITVL